MALRSHVWRVRLAVKHTTGGEAHDEVENTVGLARIGGRGVVAAARGGRPLVEHVWRSSAG